MMSKARPWFFLLLPLLMTLGVAFFPSSDKLDRAVALAVVDQLQAEIGWHPEVDEVVGTRGEHWVVTRRDRRSDDRLWVSVPFAGGAPTWAFRAVDPHPFTNLTPDEARARVEARLGAHGVDVATLTFGGARPQLALRGGLVPQELTWSSPQLDVSAMVRGDRVSAVEVRPTGLRPQLGSVGRGALGLLIGVCLLGIAWRARGGSVPWEWGAAVATALALLTVASMRGLVVSSELVETPQEPGAVLWMLQVTLGGMAWAALVPVAKRPFRGADLGWAVVVAAGLWWWSQGLRSGVAAFDLVLPLTNEVRLPDHLVANWVLATHAGLLQAIMALSAFFALAALVPASRVVAVVAGAAVALLAAGAQLDPGDGSGLVRIVEQGVVVGGLCALGWRRSPVAALGAWLLLAWWTAGAGTSWWGVAVGTVAWAALTGGLGMAQRWIVDGLPPLPTEGALDVTEPWPLSPRVLWALGGLGALVWLAAVGTSPLPDDPMLQGRRGEAMSAALEVAGPGAQVAMVDVADHRELREQLRAAWPELLEREDVAGAMGPASLPYWSLVYSGPPAGGRVRARKSGGTWRTERGAPSLGYLPPRGVPTEAGRLDARRRCELDDDAPPMQLRYGLSGDQWEVEMLESQGGFQVSTRCIVLAGQAFHGTRLVEVTRGTTAHARQTVLPVLLLGGVGAYFGFLLALIRALTKPTGWVRHGLVWFGVYGVVLLLFYAAYLPGWLAMMSSTFFGFILVFGLVAHVVGAAFTGVVTSTLPPDRAGTSPWAAAGLGLGMVAWLGSPWPQLTPTWGSVTDAGLAELAFMPLFASAGQVFVVAAGAAHVLRTSGGRWLGLPVVALDTLATGDPVRAMLLLAAWYAVAAVPRAGFVLVGAGMAWGAASQLVSPWFEGARGAATVYILSSLCMTVAFVIVSGWTAPRRERVL